MEFKLHMPVQVKYDRAKSRAHPDFDLDPAMIYIVSDLSHTSHGITSISIEGEPLSYSIERFIPAKLCILEKIVWGVDA